MLLHYPSKNDFVSELDCLNYAYKCKLGNTIIYMKGHKH